MKRILAILLLLVLGLLMFALPYAVADPAEPEPPAAPGVAVTTPPAEPQAQPIVIYTTGADPPMVDLTPLLQAVLSLAVTLITAFLIPWINAKYSAEQRWKIAAVYNTLVYAADQIFSAAEGEKKLKWVEDQLAARGITADRATIEAEVKKMKGLGYAITEGIADPPMNAT